MFYTKKNATILIILVTLYLDNNNVAEWVKAYLFFISDIIHVFNKIDYSFF